MASSEEYTKALSKAWPIPETHINNVPRCPLCGLLLDTEIMLPPDISKGMALLTITARSLRHVAKPHSMALPGDVPREHS